ADHDRKFVHDVLNGRRSPGQSVQSTIDSVPTIHVFRETVGDQRAFWEGICHSVDWGHADNGIRVGEHLINRRSQIRDESWYEVRVGMTLCDAEVECRRP